MNGLEVKEALKKMGVNLRELSVALNFKNDQRLHSILRSTDVKTSHIEKIAQALNLDVAEFYNTTARNVSVVNSVSASGGSIVHNLGESCSAELSESLCKAIDEVSEMRKMLSKYIDDSMEQSNRLISVVEKLSNSTRCNTEV